MAKDISDALNALDSPFQSARAIEFWDDVQEENELGLAGTLLLEEICRLIDDIEATTDLISTEGRTITNPESGVVKSSPHVTNLARMRTQLGSLVVRLDLGGQSDPAKRRKRR